MSVKRCFWPGMDDPVYQAYHDHEWGKLNLDETYLYEMLVLESFQAGLSWLTVLKKRESFRKAFAGFDVEKVAAFDEEDEKRLLSDSSIIRNKRKIDAAIHNARVLSAMHKKGETLAGFLRERIPRPIVHHPKTMADLPAQDDLSRRISKDLKAKGFQFVGPVTIYSYLQAVGLINDHIDGCGYKYSG